MPLLAAIADDYTGASDLANTWRKAGLRTIQTIGVPGLSIMGDDVDAVVVSLKIRSVEAGEAVRAVLDAEAVLVAAGTPHVMYKVCSTFDSTDAGNIGPVTDALRDRTGSATMLVTPAFPETGRTVYQGHLFVNGVPLAESPLKDHPLNPMRDSDLRRVLARQSDGRVGLLAHDRLRRGVDLAVARLDDLRYEGIRSVIADAVSDEDLDVLGGVAIRFRASTGASGLGLGLARAVMAGRGREVCEPPVGADMATGPAAIVVGSCSERTREQVAHAERIMPVLRLDPDRLVTSGGDVVDAVRWATERISDGPVLVTAGADPARVAEVQGRHGRAESGLAIEHAIATLAERLVESGVGRLVVAGGETSGAVVDRLRIPAFRIEAEIAPGLPALRTLGRPGGELSMVLKSGNFGSVDFFEAALRAV